MLYIRGTAATAAGLKCRISLPGTIIMLFPALRMWKSNVGLGLYLHICNSSTQRFQKIFSAQKIRMSADGWRICQKRDVCLSMDVALEKHQSFILHSRDTGCLVTVAKRKVKTHQLGLNGPGASRYLVIRWQPPEWSSLPRRRRRSTSHFKPHLGWGATFSVRVSRLLERASKKGGRVWAEPTWN